jgi:hypothetical protein
MGSEIGARSIMRDVLRSAIVVAGTQRQPPRPGGTWYERFRRTLSAPPRVGRDKVCRYSSGPITANDAAVTIASTIAVRHRVRVKAFINNRPNLNGRALHSSEGIITG